MAAHLPAGTLAPLPRKPIDWRAKLHHFVLMLGFCLAISLVLYGFQPHSHFGPKLTYPLAIGLTSWLLIDFGRHAFPSSAVTGWPTGFPGLALMVGGNALGCVIGTAIAATVSIRFGWLPPSHYEPGPELRNSLLISLVAALVGSYWFYSRSRSSFLQRQRDEAQRHADEARLKLLEAQLEPHMLFNTLANLRALIAVDPGRAQQMLDHMIAYLRATLDASRATTHGLQAEFDRLRDYLELMSIRMGPRLAYTLQLPAQLATQQVPTLLLQPLVENSIQHGLEPKVEGGRITVTARSEGGELVLEVADTGIGTTAPQQQGRGFGLAQIRDRLATLHGPRGALELVPNAQGGMRAVVRLPLQS